MVSRFDGTRDVRSGKSQVSLTEPSRSKSIFGCLATWIIAQTVLLALFSNLEQRKMPLSIPDWINVDLCQDLVLWFIGRHVLYLHHSGRKIQLLELAETKHHGLW